MTTVHVPLLWHRMLLCWGGMEGLMSFFRLVLHMCSSLLSFCWFANPAFSISFSSSSFSFSSSSSSSYSSAFFSHALLLILFFLFLFLLYLLFQAMRPMLYGADVEVINVLHPCMIQLLPIMVGPTPRDIVLPLKVTHVHHMVSGLPECVVISLICHLHAHVLVC